MCVVVSARDLTILQSESSFAELGKRYSGDFAFRWRIIFFDRKITSYRRTKCSLPVWNSEKLHST